MRQRVYIASLRQRKEVKFKVDPGTRYCVPGFFFTFDSKTYYMSDCLKDIVGVTANTQIPFYDQLDPEQQTAIAVSGSGNYMDKLTGGIDLMGVDDVDYMKAVLNLGLDARNEASRILNDELLVAINNRFHPSKSKYNGFIGRRTISATNNSTANLQGQRYRTHQPIAGLISISSIALCLNGVGSFNVYIDRCNTHDCAITTGHLYTFPVTTVANTWTNVDMSSQPGGIQLPLEVEGLAQEYYIYWNREEAGGLLPKNNDMKCGSCGGKVQSEILLSFMNYDGVAFTDTNKLMSVRNDRMGHGISVSAVVGCDHATVICREYDKKEAVKLMMQKAAQYKAGELWIEYILKSSWVNRDGLQSKEYMWGKRNHFSSEFDKRITAIANAMELGETNCYVCKNDTMMKGTIYS